MVIKWEKTKRQVSTEGTTITYSGKGTDIEIESRKRHIPHANGKGTWDHTSYFVLEDGKEVKEKQSLKDAKEFAESLFGGDKGC